MRGIALACTVAIAFRVEAAPPAEVYGADPSISQVEISPDGTKLAMLTSDGEREIIQIADLTTGSSTGFDASGGKYRAIEWSGPNHIILYASATVSFRFMRTANEYGAAFSIDVRDMSRSVSLLGNNNNLALQGGLSDVRGVTGNDNGDVYMAARVTLGDVRTTSTHNMATGAGTRQLLRVDGKTGLGRVIAKGTESTWHWVASPEGYVVARIDYSDQTDRFRIATPRSDDRLGDFETAFQEETAIPEIEVYGASPDGDALIVGAYRESGRYALHRMDPIDGTIRDALFQHDVVDISGPIIDRYDGSVVGARFTTQAPDQVFFASDLQALLLGLRKAMPDMLIRIASWDRARNRFIVYASNADNAGTYFMFDRAANQFVMIGKARAALAPSDLSRVKPFDYDARDGLTIHAFLTTPPDKEAKNLPLVVMPHGGPASRDSIEFDWWAQFIASRGYAVLKTNFRGSSGYGKTFENAGHREWGGKMQDDVTDGVKHLIAEGIVDPSKICIVVGSYGGYAAMAGAAFTPDLYKCAVSVNGVTDLQEKLSWIRSTYGDRSSTYAYWLRSVGDPATDLAVIKARSPAQAADQVKADVLLIHGKDDTVVDIEQSELMDRALRKAGKSVTFVKLDGEDHWLSMPKTRIEMLKTLEGFLAKHLGP